MLLELMAPKAIMRNHANLATFGLDDCRLFYIDEMGVAAAGCSDMNVRLLRRRVSTPKTLRLSAGEESKIIEFWHVGFPALSSAPSFPSLYLRHGDGNPPCRNSADA